jgi:beta-glucanase (GH16 family)
MRSIIFLLLFGVVSFCIAYCTNQQKYPDDDILLPTPAKEWKLVWSDEFDYTGLPASAKWSYEEGFVRNNENQYYTKARSENISVNNGILVITGRKEQYLNAAYKPGSTDWKTKDELASYTSACLITKGKFSWTYGKVEVRAKLPEGKGTWPAIWTLGDNIWEVGWPRCGEIDIMEYVGFEPNTIHTNIHYEKASDGQYATQMKSKDFSGISDDFHIYGMEWDENKIIILMDGIVVNSFEIRFAGNIFKKPQYLLLNLALGGSWGGEIDDTIFPVKYEVDYVRIYQEK